MSESKTKPCPQCQKTIPRERRLCMACTPPRAAGPSTPEVEAKRTSAPPKMKERKPDAPALPALDCLPSEFELEVKHAKRAARLKILKDYFASAYMEGDELDSLPGAARDFLRNIAEKAERKEAAKKSSNMWFITVNPKVGHTLQELQTRVAKALKKKYVASALYAYEITGNADRSPHCHMLITLTEEKPQSIIKREFGNTFKDLTSALDVKMVPDLDDYDRRANYVTGVKADAAKQQDIYDIVEPWRQAT